MDVLRGDGVVEAKQGTGFIVAETPIGRPSGGRKAGSTRVSGGMAFLRVGVPDWIVPPAHIASVLGLDVDVKALRRVRVMQMPDGSPHSYVQAWFPPDVAELSPRLAQTGPIGEGTTRYVRRQTGRFPVEGVDVTTVRLATTEEAAHLALAELVPVAVVQHTAYDQE